MLLDAVDTDLDRGLAHKLARVILVDQHPKTFKLKRLILVLSKLTKKELQAAIGAFELVPVVFEFFDVLQECVQIDILLIQTSEFSNFVKQVTFSRQIRNQDTPGVSYSIRIHVLISFWVFVDTTHMESTFVGEGTSAHERKIIGHHQIGGFTHKVGKGSEAFELFRSDRLFTQLQLQRRDHGTEIGVSSTFPISVDGSLNHTGSSLDCGNGIGHSHLTVIVGMDTQEGKFRA